jgi:hypothetical protein
MCPQCSQEEEGRAQNGKPTSSKGKKGVVKEDATVKVIMCIFGNNVQL